MDKRITPQGILSGPRNIDKKPTQNPQNNRKESKESFEINKNEFPSLNEVSKKCANGKTSLDPKPSSYSGKLKNLPNKSKSFKFESAYNASTKEPSSAKEVTIGRHKNSVSPTVRSPSVDSNSMASGFSNRNSSGEAKLQKNQSNERNVPTHPSANKQYSSKTKDASNQKDDYSFGRSQRAKSMSNKNDGLPDSVKTISSHPASKIGDAKAYERRLAVKNNSQNEKTCASTSGTQNEARRERNSLKSQDEKGASPVLELQTGEGKKKKKRKSKVKRQAALQTGKILVLTPELHSRIMNQNNATYPKQIQNKVTNINDSEEYPELGSSVKSNKENFIKSSEHSSKDSILPENNPATNKNDSDLTVPSSASDSNVVKKDQETVVKPQETEKVPVLLKDPISVSIFDMLQNAKSRKKDIARKGETTSLESPMGNINPLPKVIGKKGVSHAVNPLDASRPSIKRGKEREKPKVKKPSRMRKLILMGRQLRKEEMENCEDTENTDGAYTSLSDECLSPSKLNPVESSLVHPNGNALEDMSCGAENKIDVIEAINTYSENPSEQIVHASDETSDNPAEETGNKSCFSADISVKNIVENNSVNDSVESVELKHSVLVEELNNGSLTDFLSNQLNHSSNNLLNHETIKSVSSASDNKLANDEENSSPILKALQAKTSLFSVEARPIVNFINKSNESALDLLSLDTKIPNSVPQNINSLGTQEDDSEVDSSFALEKSCDDLQMIENSSNQLMNLMKNITLKPQVTDELKTEAVKTLIHTRKFRKYCNHFVSKGMDEVVFALLDDLARFQDRMHQKDPVKARIRKRLLYGIKEIKRHMKLKKLKGIIIATDIEDIKTEGGLNDVINEIITLAEAYHIPYIFSHRRFNLGKVCRKGVPVSCVGIFNYEGSEKNFKRILELQEESKLDYSTVTDALSQVLSCDEVSEVLKLGKGVPEKLQEVRTSLLKEHFKVESDQNKLESVKILGDLDKNGSCKEPSIPKTNEIDKVKVHHILLKYHFL